MSVVLQIFRKKQLSQILPPFPRPFWFLTAGSFLNRAGNFVMPFFVLYLTSQRGLSISQATLIISLMGAGSLGASFLGGLLADTLGRRKTILVSLLVSGGLMFALGCIQFIPLLIVCALCLQFFNQLSRPAFSATVADMVPQEQRAQAARPEPRDQPPAPLWALLVGLGATNVMVYWAIIAVSHAINYFRKYQEREFRLAQAELQALRTQLHPHFLFNTLNAIAELVYSDPKVADRSILRLSELLRFSLASEKTQEVTLKEEIEFLEKYVEIHKTLMRDRLNVRVCVDPETLDAAVPNMIVQPLVENAIKHGISPRPAGGNIEVHARRLNGKLYVEITDDGVGMPETDAQGGVGLINTRERLKHLYNDAHTFDLSSLPGKGVTVRISVPFREVGNDTNLNY